MVLDDVQFIFGEIFKLAS